MRLRPGWMLVALFTLLASPLAADEVKKKEGKDEKLSPPLRLDYGILSDVPEVEPNDAPAQANLLGCGNTLRPAEIAVQAVRDTDWIAFTANAGDVITFGTDADGATPVGDTRISIVSDDGNTVLGTDDDGGPLAYSLLSLCAPYTGTYYGRIAAFGSQTGTYMAFLICSPSSAPNDQCANATPLACGPIDLSGSTANACPDYTLPVGGCTGFAADGKDVVYRLEVLAGDSLYIDYAQSAADATIYLVTDCSDPAGTCVAGEDSTLVGGHETLSYRFASDGTYYLLLDSFSAGSGGPWTATGVFDCVPDHVDSLARVHGGLDLAGPWGVETIGLNGQALLNATVRELEDTDLNGREQFPIELAGLELTGNSLNVGPITLRVRPTTSHPFLPSAGQVEELLNATPGVPDLPPFAPGGTAAAQLQAYVEVDLPLLKVLLHNDAAVPMSPPLFTHYPPAAGETFFSTAGAPLLGSNETPTPYQIDALKLTLEPAVAVETLANSRMTLDLLGPLGLETVTLKGSTIASARLGNACDTDGDGLEQVEAGIEGLTLSGVSLLYGPVQLSLSPPAPHSLPGTAGEIEEHVNEAGGQLEIPPISFEGTAASWLDFFFRLDVDGARYHNHVAKHLTATITGFPPAPGEVYRNFVATPLVDESDAPSPFQARRMFFTPYDPKPTETVIDSMATARIVVDLKGPWGFDQIVLSDTIVTEIEMGALGDPDQDLLEEVPARIRDVRFTSAGSLYGHVPGPIVLQLAGPVALGGIEESANYTPNLLDVRPFTSTGTVECFFDLDVELEIPGYPTLHVASPLHAAATFSLMPIGPGDTYVQSGEVALVDDGEVPSGIVITGLRLTPQTSGGTVGVPEPAPPGAPAIREIRPNPAAGDATVTLALPRPADARVAAYDVNGRLVRTLWNGSMDAGVRTLTWDGRSDRGDRVPGGIYFIRFESGGRLDVRRLAILR